MIKSPFLKSIVIGMTCLSIPMSSSAIGLGASAVSTTDIIVNSAMKTTMNVAIVGGALVIAGMGSQHIISSGMKIAQHNKFVAMVKYINERTHDLLQMDLNRSPGPVLSIYSSGNSSSFWYIDSSNEAAQLCKGELPLKDLKGLPFLPTTVEAQRKVNQRCRYDSSDRLNGLNMNLSNAIQRVVLGDFSRLTSAAETMASRMYVDVDKNQQGQYFYIDSTNLEFSPAKGFPQDLNSYSYLLTVKIIKKNTSNKSIVSDCRARVTIKKSVVDGELHDEKLSVTKSDDGKIENIGESQGEHGLPAAIRSDSAEVSPIIYSYLGCN